MGYNEACKTRVHNNVGADCIFRESMQLNFDDNDEESKMSIVVCNQDTMLSSTIAQRTFNNQEVRQLLRRVPASTPSIGTKRTSRRFTSPVRQGVAAPRGDQHRGPGGARGRAVPALLKGFPPAFSGLAPPFLCAG